MPDNAKSALVGRALEVEHVTLGVMRVREMTPERPEPSSLNEYENCPLSHEENDNVPVPTCCAAVAGAALKLPPMF